MKDTYLTPNQLKKAIKDMTTALHYAKQDLARWISNKQEWNDEEQINLKWLRGIKQARAEVFSLTTVINLYQTRIKEWSYYRELQAEQDLKKH